jgi:Tir chaperone protein (CesT) family
MIDRFNDLTLQADRHHACAIQIKQGLIVQLESDSAQEKLLIASQIIEVPPGKFRENVLKEALKMNALPDPLIGIFCYIGKINQLVLFQYYPFDILTAQRLAALLGPFIQTAEKWRDAIARGDSAPRSEYPPPPRGARL